MKLTDLESFLGTAGKKGFLTQSVLKQSLTSIEKMREVVNEDPDKQEPDLEKDGVIEDLFRRFMTIRPGELSPESANVYVNRVKKAVDNCARYKQDPLAYKSTFATGSGAAKAPASAKGKEAKRAAPAAKPSDSPENSGEALAAGGDHFLASFPLRKGFMLTTTLPKDLNTAEVKRYAFYLLSLCEDFNPVKSNIFYQDAPPAYSAIGAGNTQ